MAGPGHGGYGRDQFPFCEEDSCLEIGRAHV